VARLVEEETVWRAICVKNSVYFFFAEELATMGLKIPEHIMAVSRFVSYLGITIQRRH